MKSEYIHSGHNVSKLMYHIVFPTKYRRIVISEKIDEVIVETCKGISDRYPVRFLEIGTDRDHIHMLIQSIPRYSPTELIRIIKSITAKRVFTECPEVKKKLWGGEFWSDGYYVATVSDHGNEDVVANYVKNQGDEYRKMHQAEIEGQLNIFDIM